VRFTTVSVLYQTFSGFVNGFLCTVISDLAESGLQVVNSVFCKIATLATNVLQPSALSIPGGCVQQRLATQLLIKI